MRSVSGVSRATYAQKAYQGQYDEYVVGPSVAYYAEACVKARDDCNRCEYGHSNRDTND